ncbi:L-serine ammonia-lyase [Halostreptopolyspora alba]|uniref:L-serine dehydratase n=1 Tax=Halostreptopolyspora alba TaxID=2487137 RepID=A0A3N0ECF0_9ACTN|nr:L-serine ammonia-lyase [Nocardiopsaceae bacterium YIM 96095]
MAISVFDLFKIGIGPSSSHTVGPMKAARTFVLGLRDSGLLPDVANVRAELYGSLALTGKGHGSDTAVVLGLLGEQPEEVDVDSVPQTLRRVRDSGRLALGGEHEVPFDPAAHVDFRRGEHLPGHPNGLRFTVFDSGGRELRSHIYYSVGGGFVVDEEAAGADRIKPDDTALPYPFATASELLAICEETGMSISAVMLANEQAFGRTADEVRAGLVRIWQAMRQCVRRGVTSEGALPGGLRVARRAHRLYRQLGGGCDESGLVPPSVVEHDPDPMRGSDWITLYALAVNEENAAGGRVVTAPTNGAAGIVPAVLHYYLHFCPGADDEGAVRFLLTAGAVGILFKENASISGAEVGCQGEVGSASSMAAGGLAEALGGTPSQVENAAEIAMEHNLGLTCDPIGGLVQVPCIERNALASVKAISATRMALRGDGSHFVSLDKVIATMRNTGADMMDKYKETSRGGLAVNVIEC